jgi:hypothetical protein
MRTSEYLCSLSTPCAPSTDTERASGPGGSHSHTSTRTRTRTHIGGAHGIRAMSCRVRVRYVNSNIRPSVRHYTLATESGERASIIVGACLVGSDWFLLHVPTHCTGSNVDVYESARGARDVARSRSCVPGLASRARRCGCACQSAVCAPRVIVCAYKSRSVRLRALPPHFRSRCGRWWLVRSGESAGRSPVGVSAP